MFKEMYQKNKYSIKKGVLISVLSLSLTLAYSVTAFAANSSSYTSSYNKKFVSCSNSSFGDTANFAVFAKNYDAGCDMEGNVAAQSVKLNGVHIGLSANVEATTSSTITYVEKFATSSSCEEFLKQTNCVSPLILGNDYTVKKEDRWNIYKDGKHVLVSPISKATDIINIKNSEYKIDFNKEFDSLYTVSKNLASTANTKGVTSKKEANGNGRISCKSGFNVFNMTMAEYNSLRDFNIEISADASLIINLTDYNGQNLDNKISVNSSKQAYKGLAGNVLWNFGGYSKEIHFSETTQGCILAPKGTVVIHSSHNGNIIAHTVKNIGGEIHKNDCKCIISTGCKIKPTAPATEIPKETTPAKDNPTVTATPTASDATVTANPSGEPSSSEPAITDDTTKKNTSETEAAKKTSKKDKESPKTGDNSLIFLGIGVLVLSTVGILVLLKLKARKTSL